MLADLAACFEGVIPSIVATTAADGTPNISYLSHVVPAGPDQVALSNQFFSKTASNVRANPRAALLLVDPRNGNQFRLDMVFIESVDSGSVFEQVKRQLTASSAQAGMADVMRLKSIDVYRVSAIAQVLRAVEADTPADDETTARMPLAKVADVVESIAAQHQVDGIVDAVLEGLCKGFGYDSAMLLHLEPQRGVLTTIGSRGYERTGVGAEVPSGEGIIGQSAAERQLIKLSDLSRIRRFGAAIRSSSVHEDRTRTIALPGLQDAMSQIGVPMIAQGNVYGVLFAESRQRLAFSMDDERALLIIARQAASALVLAEALATEPQSAAAVEPRRASSGRVFRVTCHAFDDSVFIDNAYVIKGVPGRLLMFMLETLAREGRHEFTNRELRLADAIRLPDIKDNLETRLLLLRRRLKEKASPVQLVQTGRGRFRLELDGSVALERAQ